MQRGPCHAVIACSHKRVFMYFELKTATEGNSFRHLSSRSNKRSLHVAKKSGNSILHF